MKHLFGPLRHLNFWETAAFETNGGGGGGGGGGGSSSSSSSRTEADVQADINASLDASGGEWTSELNDLVSERTAIRSGGGSTASTSSSSSSSSSNDKNTVGSVSQTGQYAGDGFEFVENEGGYLTRTYTGANEDAGLGLDVIAGGTSDKATKEAIANISLNEGSAFAGSAASATDGDLLNLLNPDIEGTGRSGSYAEQVGQVDYTPTITYGDDAAAAATPAAVDTGIGSLRPVARPANLLSSQEQALVDAYNAVPDSDESYTPDAATMAAVLKSQDKTSAISEPLSVADQVASYGGVDLDAQDAATAAANNAAAATALGSDDFSYTILPTGSGGITGPDTITRSGGANNSTDALLDLSADIAEGKIGADEATATLNLITGNTLSA